MFTNIDKYFPESSTCEKYGSAISNDRQFGQYLKTIHEASNSVWDFSFKSSYVRKISNLTLNNDIVWNQRK